MLLILEILLNKLMLRCRISIFYSENVFFTYNISLFLTLSSSVIILKCIFCYNLRISNSVGKGHETNKKSSQYFCPFISLVLRLFVVFERSLERNTLLHKL